MSDQLCSLYEELIRRESVYFILICWTSTPVSIVVEFSAPLTTAQSYSQLLLC